MRVLVCGSRDWVDHDAIKRELLAIKELPGPHTLIHGAYPRGADKMADWIGDVLGYKVLPFPAEWKKYFKAAGPIRNKRMLVEGKPELVLAFTLDLENSPGTRDMVFQASKAGIPIRVFAE